jgi:hypothetical protein
MEGPRVKTGITVSKSRKKSMIASKMIKMDLNFKCAIPYNMRLFQHYDPCRVLEQPHIPKIIIAV